MTQVVLQSAAGGHLVVDQTKINRLPAGTMLSLQDDSGGHHVVEATQTHQLPTGTRLVVETDTGRQLLTPTELVPAYYVDPSGSDGNTGRSPTAAFATIAKVQSVVVAGDTILLKRGARWSETLTLPADNIVVGAYGAGAIYDSSGYGTNAPVFEGGVTLGGWSTYSGGVSDSFATDNFTGTAGNNITTSTLEVGSGGWTKVLALGDMVFSSDGCARRPTGTVKAQYRCVQQPSVGDYYVQGAVRVKSLDASDRAYLIGKENVPAGDAHNVYAALDGGNLVRVGYYFDSSGTGSGTTLASGTVPGGTVAAGNDYMLRLETEGTAVRAYCSNGYTSGTSWDPVGNPLQLIASGDYTGTGILSTSPGWAGVRLGTSAAADGSDTTGYQFVDFDIGPLGVPAGGGTPVNTYQTTLAADKHLYTLRGAFSPLGASVNTLADGYHYWVGGTLYLRSDAGIPTGSDVIRGNLTNGIICGGHNNVTIQDVAFEHQIGSAITWTGTASNGVIRRCYAQLSGADEVANGVFGWSGVTHNNALVEDSIIRHCGLDGIMFDSVTPNGLTIRGTQVGPLWGNIGDCLDIRGGGNANMVVDGCRFVLTGGNSIKGAIVLFVDGVTVKNTSFEGNTNGSNYHISTANSNLTVFNCVFIHGGSHGTLRAVGSPGANFIFHHNLFIDCMCSMAAGFIQGASSFTNMKWYNNTIINYAIQPVDGLSLGVATQVAIYDAAQGEFKNNILWNASGAGSNYFWSSEASTGSWVSDNNIIGPEGTGFINAIGSAYNTLAAYVAAKAKDQNSKNQRPVFVNLGGVAQTGVDYKLLEGPGRGTATPIPGYTTNSNLGAF